VVGGARGGGGGCVWGRSGSPEIAHVLHLTIRNRREYNFASLVTSSLTDPYSDRAPEKSERTKDKAYNAVP
jgi:hypothetical protein